MNQQTNPEEIDILQFFSAIGNIFKNMWTGIINLFKKIFFIILDALLYFKKYYLYLGAGLLLGLLISFLLPVQNKDTFKASARIRTNFQAQLALQNYVDLFNALLEEEKYDELRQILQIDTATVKHLNSFEINPVMNDVLLLDDYEEYLMLKDTVVYKFIEFKNYKKSIAKQPELNMYWDMTVYADKPLNFNFLNKTLTRLINEDPALEKYKKNILFALQTQQQKLIKSLQDIDSMRKVYDKVMLEMAQNNSNGVANIIVSGDRVRGPEGPYNLFRERQKVLTDLEKLSRKLNKYSDVLVLQNDFPQYGIKENKITDDVHFKYAFIGFMLVLLLLLLKDFIHYLNRYQQQKKLIQ